MRFVIREIQKSYVEYQLALYWELNTSEPCPTKFSIYLGAFTEHGLTNYSRKTVSAFSFRYLNDSLYR